MEDLLTSWGKCMAKLINIYISICFISFVSFCTYAGVPQLNLQCKSNSGHAAISGFPRGEGYDLKITVDNVTLRYVDICSDAECSSKEKQGDLFVVEALRHKVFTIYFVEPLDTNANVIMGYFYALPDTVKYIKTKNGYRAEYKALYDGADPRSKGSPKAFVKEPIELMCTQQEELG
jgi:hypothetical protein